MTAKSKPKTNRPPPEGSEAEDLPTDSGPGDRAPQRRCIATRVSRPAEEMIRFVRAADGSVVPDLKRRLPGRGAWVTARRWAVEEAVRRKAFGRAFRADTRAGGDLAEQVGERLKESALGALGLERRAGRVAVGFSEVDAVLRRGSAAVLLHAVEAAADGLRKLDQAAHAGGGEPTVCRAFTEAELGLALGRANVIHAALERSRGGRSAAARCRAYSDYLEDRDACGVAGTEDLGKTNE